MRLTGDQLVRAAALAAVLVVAVVVAITLLGRGPGGGYTVKARFQNAAQLVKGNLVQTGGAPVGTVTTIDLTEDGQAEVTMKIERRMPGSGPRTLLRERRNASVPHRSPLPH